MTFVFCSPTLSLMGGDPRRATSKARDRGEMCCACHAFLPEPHQPGHRYCQKCQPRHAVLMIFDRLPGGWRVSFRQTNHWPLPRAYTFTNPDKIRDLYTRFGSSRIAEDVASFEFGLQNGRGVVELTLEEEQYRVLHMEKAPTRRAGSDR